MRILRVMADDEELSVTPNDFVIRISWRQIVARIVCASAIALGFSGCADEPSPTPEVVIRPVRYLDVVAADATATYVFSGSAEADEAADISFKVAGTLSERPVNVGDKVAGGDLLGTLDNRDFSVAVREAEANLARALAEARNADANYDRLRELYENENVSKSELDSARAGAESAHAQVRVARQSLTNRQLQLSYTKIVAPDRCEIAETFVKVNENVTSGQPIVRLNCGDCPDVRVSVPETHIGEIEAGNVASVTFAALPERRFKAIIEEVGVAKRADSSAFIVNVAIVTDCELVRSGMAADVSFSFTADSSASLIRVPWVAVGEDSDGRFVYVLESIDHEYAVAKRRSIEILGTSERGINLKSGLVAGERIVTAGVRRISDNMKVKLYAAGPLDQPQ